MKALNLVTIAAILPLIHGSTGLFDVRPGPPVTLGALDGCVLLKGVAEEAARSCGAGGDWGTAGVRARGREEVRQGVCPGRVPVPHAGMAAAAFFHLRRDGMAPRFAIVVAARTVAGRSDHLARGVPIGHDVAVGAGVARGVLGVGEASLAALILDLCGTVLGREGHGQGSVSVTVTRDAARLEVSRPPRLGHKIRRELGPVVTASAVEPHVQSVIERRGAPFGLLPQRLEVTLAALLIAPGVMTIHLKAQRDRAFRWDEGRHGRLGILHAVVTVDAKLFRAPVLLQRQADRNRPFPVEAPRRPVGGEFGLVAVTAKAKLRAARKGVVLTRRVDLVTRSAVRAVRARVVLVTESRVANGARLRRTDQGTFDGAEQLREIRARLIVAVAAALAVERDAAQGSVAPVNAVARLAVDLVSPPERVPPLWPKIPQHVVVAA